MPRKRGSAVPVDLDHPFSNESLKTSENRLLDAAQLDPPASALVGVIAILKELEPDDRSRILKAAGAYFDTPPSRY